MTRILALLLAVLAGCATDPIDDPIDETDDPGYDEPLLADPGEPEDVPSIGALAPTTASCSTTSGDNIARLRCYQCTKACDGSRPAFCTGGGFPTLETACIAATTHDGQTVFRWYEAGSDDVRSPQEYLRPFVLLGYLRILRNTARSNPTSPAGNFEAMLTAQLDYLAGQAKAYPADANGPASRVWQTYYESGSAIRRYADGLTQSAYAIYYLTVAKNYLADPAKRDRYLDLALAADNAMERPAGNKTGGIRVKSPVACGAPGLTGQCWYFHSRAPSNQLMPGTAVNQSLYVTRAAEQLLVELAAPEWATSWPTAIARDAWQERLRDRIAAALSQWAYGDGNIAAASQPPNLRDHWMRAGTTEPYYWSYYQFDLANHVPENRASAKHVCNYHSVNVNNLAGILNAIDPVDPDGAGALRAGDAVPQLGSGVRRDRIDQARKALLTYTKGGVPEARGAKTARQVVYQWFVSEITPAIREGQQGCDPAGANGLEGLYPATKSYFCHRFGAFAATPNAALVTLCQ